MLVQYVGTANKMALFITSEPLLFDLLEQKVKELPDSTAKHLLGLKSKDGKALFLSLETGGAPSSEIEVPKPKGKAKKPPVED